MGNFDTKFRQGAKRVLDKIQGTATNAVLTEAYTRAQYSPSTGGVSGAPATHALRTSPVFFFKDEMVDGDTIQAGDGYVVVDQLELEARSATAVDNGWLLTKNGVDWRVVRTTKHSGGDLDCLVEIHLRK